MFKLKLTYNDAANTSPQWNGNIAGQYWGGQGEDINNLSKKCDYGYDKLNRLTSGTATTGQYEQGIGYDKNGNTTGLVRNLPQEGVNIRLPLRKWRDQQPAAERGQHDGHLWL